jgi:hypothetical protein
MAALINFLSSPPRWLLVIGLLSVPLFVAGPAHAAEVSYDMVLSSNYIKVGDDFSLSVYVTPPWMVPPLPKRASVSSRSLDGYNTFQPT